MAELTQEELDERVATLKHFRKLLEQQRAKFQEYLTVLEKQQDSISTENTDALVAHTEMEQQVVKSITNLQKVIVPMQKMYNTAVGNGKPDEGIEVIQKELNNLQSKVLKQNEKNRELLKCHIVELRSRIKNFQNPYRNSASVYAASSRNSGRMIEVEV